MTVTVVIDDAGLESLFAPAGPVQEFVTEVTVKVYGRSLFRAPIGQPSKTPQGHPAGWLRSQIHWEHAEELTTRVITEAVNSEAAPVPGNPYARQIEKPNERPYAPPPFARGDQPYLVPALDDVWREVFG